MYRADMLPCKKQNKCKCYSKLKSPRQVININVNLFYMYTTFAGYISDLEASVPLI